MATQPVSHSTATAFQKMGVQRVEALEHWDWYEEVPARIADQPFDFALVVAFAGSAEPILEQVVRLQLGEHARPLSFAVPEDAGHRDLGVVIQDRLWNPAEECECPNVAVAEGFRCLCRIADHEAGVRMRQVKSQEVDLALNATDDADGFTKVCLSVPWRMHQRHEHLLRPLPPAGDIVLHNRNAAREPILIAQPLEDPLCRLEKPIVRLILDGTVVRVRLDRKATSISLLVVIGVRADGQKVLLAIESMGGERPGAWRTVLDDLIKRGLRRPEFLIVDGAPGLDKAIASIWHGVPVQRCTVHKHRNLFAHAPERLHDEITADYNDMIYAATPEEIEVRRKAFIRKWRLKHRAVADSLEEAGGRLFTFPRLPPSQWRSLRTTNAIERLHEEFKRRIKTQTVLPSADTAAMLFWALLASGQINMRKVDGWQTLATNPIDRPIDLAA